MKILYLHIVKSGGTTANQVLAQTCNRRGYFVHRLDDDAKHDFSREQLEEIAKFPKFDQYAHAHIAVFDEQLHSLFRQNGWFTICLVRNPADLLCSLFHFTKDLPEGMDLNNYIAEVLEGEDSSWHIPAWFQDISFCRLLSSARIRSFCETFLNERLEHVPLLNQSGSKGFAHYLVTGAIKTKTVKALLNHEQTKRFQKVAALG